MCFTGYVCYLHDLDIFAIYEWNKKDRDISEEISNEKILLLAQL